MKDDKRTAAILDDLRGLGEADTRDDRFRRELADLLLARAAIDDGGVSASQPLVGNRKQRLRPLASLAAAVAVLALAMSFLLAGHPRASAEALLRRAAAVTFQPNQARHFIYDITMTLPGHVAHGTGEIWIATDGVGRPVLASETLRLAKMPAGPTAVIERDLQTPLGTYTYDGTHNAIVIPSRNDPSWSISKTAALPLPAYLFDGTRVARRLADLYAQGAARVQLLSRRNVGGSTVDAVQVDGWPNGAAVTTTFYFDTGTHLLRGFDSHGTDPTYGSPVWRVRLAQHSAGPRDSAPSDAFALDAPGSAQASPPPPALIALPTLCRSQPKLLLSRGKSLLQACRAANPAITESTLLSALVGTAPQDLATAVAANAITPNQAHAALQAQRAQILAMLSGSRPFIKISAAPIK